MQRLKRYEINKYAGSRLERKPGMQVSSLNFTLNSLGNHLQDSKQGRSKGKYFTFKKIIRREVWIMIYIKIVWVRESQ